MRSIVRVCLGVTCLAGVLVGATPAYAGKIVVANDEWHTSQIGFGVQPASATAFVQNVAAFFAGGPGNFLVVSTNFSLDPDQATSFVNALTTAGHTVTDYANVAGFSFDVATLSGYDGVFLALLPAVDQTVLTNYVNGGGNVYVHAGTGHGGAAVEAAAWNTFLGNFGLAFAPFYNGIGGNVPIASSHPIMTGVTALWHGNGNSILLTGGNPNAQIIASYQQQGMYAVYQSGGDEVPEPATLVLLAGSIVWVGARRRARR